MSFQWSSTLIGLVISYTFNIISVESQKVTQIAMNNTYEQATQLLTDFSFDFSEVFGDASGVFSKVLGKMMTKKKFLGIESFYLRK